MRKLLACLVLLAASSAATAVTHEGVGVVRAIEAGGQVLVIEHHAIPGFMDAMTMPFELGDPRLARGVKVGDTVRFTITRSGDFWPITALARVREGKRRRAVARAAGAAVSPAAVP